MFQELESLAALKHGKEVEKLGHEYRDKLSSTIANYASRGLANSGPMVKAKLDLKLELIEHNFKSLVDIWAGLIINRDSRLSREAIQFILEKIENASLNAKKQVKKYLL